MSRLKNVEVLSLLVNLANGWRQPLRKKKLFVHHGASSSLLEQYPVNGTLILVWTVDILEEKAYYIQILKIWDILPLFKMSKLANHLDFLFGNYTVDKMNRCKHKCFDRYVFMQIDSLSLCHFTYFWWHLRDLTFVARIGKFSIVTCSCYFF